MVMKIEEMKEDMRVVIIDLITLLMPILTELRRKERNITLGIEAQLRITKGMKELTNLNGKFHIFV